MINQKRQIRNIKTKTANENMTKRRFCFKYFAFFILTFVNLNSRNSKLNSKNFLTQV